MEASDLQFYEQVDSLMKEKNMTFVEAFVEIGNEFRKKQRFVRRRSEYSLKQ